MFSGHRLHVVGSNNTEYQYPIFDDPNDIPTGMTSFKYQIDANTTGYIKALPQSQYPVAGLHIKDGSNRIITAYSHNTCNCNLQWHWNRYSDPYHDFCYICPDSATLDFGIHTELEVVVYWHTTGIGWQSAVVGTIPAGATSITMTGQYGGISSNDSQIVTAFYFLVRSKVAYRQISGYCVYTMASATITAQVHLSEPLPVGHIYLYADWYGALPPFSMHFGGFDVIGAGVQDGSSFYSFDPYMGLMPTSYYTFLRYFPETAGAYGARDFVGRPYAPAGGGQWTDNFTLDIPTGASQDIGTTPQYGTSSSDTGYNITVPEVYW